MTPNIPEPECENPRDLLVISAGGPSVPAKTLLLICIEKYIATADLDNDIIVL